MGNKKVYFTRHALQKMRQRDIDPISARVLLPVATRLYPPKIYHSERTQIYRIENKWFIVDMASDFCKVITAYRRNHI